jgi:2-polyprenyl-3-methyl-5-hydroxy-6-metoxy-1,4-benzoquinol methylase
LINQETIPLKHGDGPMRGGVLRWSTFSAIAVPPSPFRQSPFRQSPIRQDETVMNAEPRYFHRDNIPPLDAIYTQAELDVTPWYYSMEMEPGQLTSGQTFANVGLTRTLLQRADLNGQSCLDIGTMEGLIPILMRRRGARNVTAYDRPAALTSRIASVKKRFGVEFDFVSGFPLAQLPANVDHRTFDVVVMSGVLYHLFSPLAGLAIARGLLRDGGLMIVETAAVIAGEPAMYWNSAFRFGGESYFHPSVACLDYFARFLHMEIIDCAYLEATVVDGLRPARVAFTCRAVTDVPGDPEDHFIKGTLHTETDLAECLDWKRCASALPLVAYEAPPSRTLRHQPLPFRALRRATRNAGLQRLSKRIDDAIENRTRPASYWLRSDCRSIDLARVCMEAKRQHVSDRDTQLWLSDTA